MTATALAATPGAIPFTDEQRAAIEDRDGSALLAANAGSGKTAVMAERCVEAVLQDGVPVGSILALTFTEKAAGELRDRVRRRFLALGEEEHAREVDAGWIGTIHGFCARVLRSRPLAAGLDPRFEVLDEGAAERLARDAYDRAFEDWAAARGAAAVDVAAAFGPGLRDLVLAAHSTLRSRGQTRPVLPIPPPAPTPIRPSSPPPAPRRPAASRPRATARARGGAGRAGELRAGCSARAACRCRPCSRRRAQEGLEGARAGAVRRVPRRLDRLPPGLRRPPRAARAGRDRRPATRFGAAYAEAKAARAGLDFEDLELGVRDLLAGDRAGRERWAERFRLIMVDEFQDTNRLQLDILRGARARQPVRGRRRVPVDLRLPPRRRDDLPRAAGRAGGGADPAADRQLPLPRGAAGRPQRRLRPAVGERFAPLLAGGTESDSGELRLFDPGEPGDTEPRVELLVTDSRGWEDDDRLGLAGVEAKPHRRAEARVIAHRLRRELEAGRAARDIVVLVRATASLRLFEEALEEQGVPTYVVGGRGYWSQQPVRDGLAYLAALANPLDEEALLGTLASPFCGVGSDALILLSQGEGVWAHAARRGPARAPRRGRRAAAAVRRLLRRRARARRAAAGRGAARAGARGDRLRPRRPRPRRRRAAAGQPAQADAAGARVRARRGAGPARLPRLRRHARPRRRPRGRGAARVRGARRRAADDDPPRQGARVPGRLRRGPRPPGRRPDRAAAARRRRRGRAAALDARRRRDRARAGLRAARRRDGRATRTPRSAGSSTSP